VTLKVKDKLEKYKLDLLNKEKKAFLMFLENELATLT